MVYQARKRILNWYTKLRAGIPARGKKKSGKNIADEVDLEQFEIFARMPELVRIMKELVVAERGRTFEEEVQIVTDTVREKFGVPRKGSMKPPRPH